MGSTETLVCNDNIQWTEHGIPIRNLWYMLLYAWNEPPLKRADIFDGIEDSPTLDALLASILVRLLQQRLRIGLGRNYMDEQHLLRGIRGRIDFNESLKHRALEHGQAYCRFQQYSLNVPKNQIVRSTLARLIQGGQFGPDYDRANELRHNLRWLARTMEGIDLVELRLDFIRRQQFGRNDRDYRLMLAVCELLLQRQMPTDSTGNHNVPALDRDALVLHNIYERFVVNFYRANLPEWKVESQKCLHWHQKNPSPYLPSMYPDIFMEHKPSGRIVIVDTKFTRRGIVRNQWGNEAYNSPHLYQLYAYVKTQEHISEHHRQASGILLYPVVNQTKVSERIELQDQVLRIEMLDLAAPWQDIETSLLGLVSD